MISHLSLSLSLLLLLLLLLVIYLDELKEQKRDVFLFVLNVAPDSDIADNYNGSEWHQESIISSHWKKLAWEF